MKLVVCNPGLHSQTVNLTDEKTPKRCFHYFFNVGQVAATQFIFFFLFFSAFRHYSQFTADIRHLKKKKMQCGFRKQRSVKQLSAIPGKCSAEDL